VSQYSDRPQFDLSAIYRETRLRLLDLAPALSDKQLSTVTPTCPDWTVKDVFAHLTGLASEVTRGRLEELGSSERTAAQVNSRKDFTIEKVCEEWRFLGDSVDELIVEARRALTPLVVDAWTHEQDLSNAAGVQSGREGSGLFLTMNVVWRLKGKIRQAGIPSLRVISGRVDWVIGDTDPAAVLRLSEYEMARAFMARRSIDQLRSYSWEGDPEPYLPLIPYFEPPLYEIVE